MRPRSGVLTCIAVLGVAIGSAASGTAAAAAPPAPIGGTLTRGGYTVIAVAANGKATAVRSATGRFSLRPPARTVTLHLRTRGGVYAGPVVLASTRRGDVTVLGVKAGARLGRIAVRSGYSKPTRKPARRWIVSSRWARAKKGLPVGARVFGLVRTVRPARAPAGDLDADGIPNPLDVDDDGDRTLDNLDRTPRARRAQAEVSLGLTPSLPLSIDTTANANATGLTPQQSDDALRQNGRIEIGSALGGELDCGGQPDPGDSAGWIGGLPYCVRGGTGTLFPTSPGPITGGPRFPECCDLDADGLGSLAPGGGIALVEGTSHIHSGDLLIERVGSVAYPGTLQYVFATVPALVSFADSAGTAATVSYPVARPVPPASGGPGTTGNGFPVKADPVTGDVVVTMTFWRPQRRHTEGDPGSGDWMDIGGLTYTLQTATVPPYFCPQSSYSTRDSSLQMPPAGIPGPDMSRQPGGGFTDKSRDQLANPSHTLTFTINLTSCLASRGRSLNVGDALGLQLIARTSSGGRDAALQAFELKRVS